MASSVPSGYLSRHRARHSLSHEIARLDLHLLIELQLSAINALQDRHGDRQLVNAMHRKMLLAVQVRRFARLEELGPRRRRALSPPQQSFRIHFASRGGERGGERGSKKQLSHSRWTLAGNCLFKQSERQKTQRSAGRNLE